MELQHYKFELEPLPYDYSALEPYIDTLTMRIHHDRHLAAYVNNLNAALADCPEFHGWTLETLLRNNDMIPENIRIDVKHNAGGVFNHNFYFKAMSPMKTVPSPELTRRIGAAFGSMDNFKAEFKKAALGVFGSGYAWLAMNPGGGFLITTTANQDTLVPLNLIPLMCIDVWEHAYYLKHYNMRADYIDDWFNVARWDIKF